MDKAFREVFPIDDFSGEKLSIFYKGFTLEEPKFSVADCKRKNLNYEAPMKVRFELLNKLTGEIKEQDVYLGGIPMMTDMGTFIVSGIERIIINQIIRSTGMFFTHDPRQAGMYTMKIIPHRGSWFEIEIERKGIVNVKIDKKRKIPMTVLLRAWGFETDAEIINAFQGEDEWISKYIAPTLEKDKTKTRMEALYAIYKLLRPGDLGTDERVEQLFQTTFYDSKRFELGEVARIKINRKLNQYQPHKDAISGETEEDIYNTNQFLVAQDFLYGLKYLFSLIDGRPGFSYDDIDHLENRRVRSVGESVCVCEAQTRRFNEEASKLENTVILTISVDLPFAQKRFCAAEGIENLIMLSDYKNLDFAHKYGFELEGLRLLSRGIVCIDKNGVVCHVEYTPEVTSHPDYDKALEVVRNLG